MQIPVIMVLPSSVAMSAGVVEGGTFPQGLQLDPNYPMVPFGGNGPAITAAFGDETEREQHYVVRGFVEASLEDPPQMLDGHVVYADPEIAPFVTCGADAVGAASDVATLLQTDELLRRGMDGTNVGVVILDTGINLTHLESVLGYVPNFDSANSWTPPGVGWTAGDAPVDHGTMCAFDALIAAPSATLIDYPILSANAPTGGSVMSGFLSTALLAFAGIHGSWNSGVGSGDLSQYSGLVVSNSWGIFHPSWDFPAGHPGRYCDNPNHPFILQLETMSMGAIDVFFAAGNCGADCPDGRCQNRSVESIMGASASVDALSIAGCDINNERVGYSSQGPSIAGMYGMKPDFTAYTHFLGSQAFGVDVPDSGTSAACPVAAGCMAALRTHISPRTPATPYMMYSHFRQQATTPAGQSTGWNGDYGYGIINTVPIAVGFGH
ncbi:MAG: S8 family serine peptidase [Sphingomonadaceae bacterium]|nr:S8 family serine peptidase [Sphingomonadaceae bacterium]